VLLPCLLLSAVSLSASPLPPPPSLAPLAAQSDVPPDAPPPSPAAVSNQSTSKDPITMHQLSNGLTVIHKRNRSNRIVGLSCVVLTGSVHEEAALSGVTNLCLNVMRKGTTSRTAHEIELRIDELGISLNDSAGEDFSSWSLVSTLDDWDAALDLLAEILLQPSFPPDEIENERKQVLAAIRRAEDDKFAFTYKSFKKVLYSGHPYSQPVEGIPETVSALTREQLVELHANWMMPSNMIVSVVGDLEESRVLRALEKRLGGACPLPRRRVLVGKEFLPRPASTELRRKIEQGFLCIGHVTAPVSSRDYPALRLTSTILGEGMSARLFTILRDRDGLAYAVGSMHRAQRRQGHLMAYIGTKPETVDRAREGILEQIDRLKREPVSEEELTRARNYTVGRYLMAHQTNANQAYYLAYWQALGMGVDFDAAFPELLEKVTVRDIMKVANKYFIEPTVVVLRPEPAVE
jgi:predicted Zn-dependent peptidase